MQFAPPYPSAAPLFRLELEIECEQLDARIEAAVHAARQEVRIAGELVGKPLGPLYRGAMRVPRFVEAAMVDARARYLKLCGLMLLVVALALVGCGDNLCGPVTLVDGRPDPEAIGWEQRAAECKAVCALEYLICPGSDSNACYDECIVFATGSAYCPPGASSRRPRKRRAKMGPALRSSARSSGARDVAAALRRRAERRYDARFEELAQDVAAGRRTTAEATALLSREQVNLPHVEPAPPAAPKPRYFEGQPTIRAKLMSVRVKLSEWERLQRAAAIVGEAMGNARYAPSEFAREVALMRADEVIRDHEQNQAAATKVKRRGRA